ncbi:MAG: ATP-binding cassette domain-containing protein [Coriobacteriales bacterium]|jgi:Ni2+-binding GTPase involved in maturation of urease and hydrogenase/ABC-type lipoprotein export system ATPase subunit|nr:ATP-binding cassette domain-containing protein [Coriobacteriales bacterium]
MLKIIQISGTAAVGKTAVIRSLLPQLANNNESVCVAKIDCLHTNDGNIYQNLGIPCVVGLSEDICPDHFLVSNLPELWQWAEKLNASMLIIETAGLCNRCSPATDKTTSICVLDCTSSSQAPKKLGPMLSKADIVVLSKIDLVSQAEREIICAQITALNPSAMVFCVDGIVGYGSEPLARHLCDLPTPPTYEGDRLRYTMPSGVCSYCVGEQRVGSDWQQGVVGKMDFLDSDVVGKMDFLGSDVVGKMDFLDSDAELVPRSPQHDLVRDLTSDSTSDSTSDLTSDLSSDLTSDLTYNLNRDLNCNALDALTYDSCTNHDTSCSNLRDNAKADPNLDFSYLEILAGHSKNEVPEDFGVLRLAAGEMYAIVGNTGSGKSRFIKDIEQLAQNDSVTGRTVLLNGTNVNSAKRQFLSTNLIAHLSQNMRFSLDLPVDIFLQRHLKVRGRSPKLLGAVIELANSITPEPIAIKTGLHELSGGQSRALMIADIALVCNSPIVLIDEVENAGINKNAALDALTDSRKLVLIVTHDVQIALMAKQRIVLSGGALSAVITRTEAEERYHWQLQKQNSQLSKAQNVLRSGMTVCDVEQIQI